MDETPAICKLKIAKSTAAPECANTPLKGGYSVQPVPAPHSTQKLKYNNKKDGGSNQKLKLFNLGNAISGAPNIIGKNIFPAQPINRGITIKKIIIKPCKVTTLLYN